MRLQCVVTFSQMQTKEESFAHTVRGEFRLTRRRREVQDSGSQASVAAVTILVDQRSIHSVPIHIQSSGFNLFASEEVGSQYGPEFYSLMTEHVSGWL